MGVGRTAGRRFGWERVEGCAWHKVGWWAHPAAGREPTTGVFDSHIDTNLKEYKVRGCGICGPGGGGEGGGLKGSIERVLLEGACVAL